MDFKVGDYVTSIWDYPTREKGGRTIGQVIKIRGNFSITVLFVDKVMSSINTTSPYGIKKARYVTKEQKLRILEARLEI